ncbi:NAD(P)/FAD-dependent oxidoreductase [Glycomyces sp. L485]|uniref:NAD(P)/FAD-dependent oxidoreductase n=1 Tax=Glycomyces sp. L485 TaxID=2909235 RepID=UPI001F4A60F8|nr:FAD/NAD(P)-binding oxidoreductase [Glycomyces sp. L485]MCH7230859.1 NAD(P)/FAD-dependent oxidoreductase [Glycomyces sp. L485]
MRRVVVVGAGPAGRAAAAATAAHGVEVVLVDSAPKLGGQYDRQDTRESGDRFALPSGVEYLPDSVVWAVEPAPGGHRVHVRTGPADSPERAGRALETRALVLATGAYDRSLPFPGWDLPGVYTAGAAQALAKSQGIAVGDRVIVAGTGPFLLPVATVLCSVGARVVAILEANDPVTGWMKRPGGAVAGWGKFGELARYSVLLGHHHVPMVRRSAVIAANGTDRLEAVIASRLDHDWNPVAHTERRFEVDAVAIGFGFTPQLELAVAARCDIEGGFVAVNAAQATSVPGVFAAGEITGIGGAELATHEGTIAGTAAAKLLGARVRVPFRAMRHVRSGRRFAAALQSAYPVRPGWKGWLRDDTLVCRCEEVPYGELRRAVGGLDIGGVRSLKLATRAGLGLCQGRVCGRNVAELAGLADAADGFSRRPVAAPVRLGELAEDTPVESER